MNAIKTNMTTHDGLRIYDLEPQAAALLAVAGPDGVDPATINQEDLPDGFRWLEDSEWAEACERSEEDNGDLMDYHTGEHIGEATRAQRDASRAAGPEGVILVDSDGEVLQADDRGADDARRCYVQE